jgi:hypothetical protein
MLPFAACCGCEKRRCEDTSRSGTGRAALCNPLCDEHGKALGMRGISHHKGMLPCFFGGLVSLLFFSISRAVINFERV